MTEEDYDKTKSKRFFNNQENLVDLNGARNIDMTNGVDYANFY